MARDLYREERRQEIVRQVNRRGRVAVSELSRQFGVSEVTIRADLQVLADDNLIERTHGGAIPAAHGLHDLSLAKRLQQQVLEKKRIGEAGASLVSDGDAVILDSSSTALAVAQCLKRRRALTIITNSLAVAHEMLDAPGVTAVMPGGTLHRDTASFIGTEGLAMLQGLNVQKGFFGAHGISISEGLTDVSADEARMKRRLVEMCGQVIAVLDATKWGRVGLASFTGLENVDLVVTDAHAPADLVEQVRELGIEVVLA